jgi:diguanylate cyclase (GGDEF)-like protein
MLCIADGPQGGSLTKVPRGAVAGRGLCEFLTKSLSDTPDGGGCIGGPVGEQRQKAGMSDRRDDMAERRRSSASRAGLYRPALFALGIGMLISLAAGYAVGQWEDRVTRVEFESVAETQVIVMQNGINEYVSRLVALRTLFESANEEITRSEFETFSGRLFERHPGILRVAWMPRINRKERAEYEAAAIADGVSGYRIKALNAADHSITTAPQNDEYLPVFFSTEPKTSMSYGLDYSTDPERRATLMRARDADVIAVMRGQLYEPRDGMRPAGVLLFVPVFAKGSPAVAINVYPPDAGDVTGPENRALPDFASEHQTLPSDVTSSGLAHWSAMLRIGDTSWPVLAAPAAGGRLIASHDRTVAVLVAGFAGAIFLAVYLALASRNAFQLSLANQRVLELAQTDILTGLPNRAFFIERLQEITSAEDGENAFSILMLDLDRFKNVNDSLGHAAGDALLRQVAERLQSTLGGDDVLARLGGDEFAIIRADCEDQHASWIDLAQRISRLIAEPFQLPGHRVEIGTSIGVAVAPEHGRGQEELLKKADLALYRSKSAGRNCYTLYDDAMLAELEARKTLEGDLRDAVARCQFEVHYQPFYDIQSGRRRGLEALVRWRHPKRGLVPPDQFIPLAEETGLIVPLGEWVIRQACDDATSWPADVKVAVNLSPVQFKEAELFDVIQSALSKSGLAPERLEVEITESVLLQQAADNLAFIERLKSIGISLALDDFGTGYSSLSYLTTFPFDKIKIDKSFIRNLTERHEGYAIISSVVTLARGLNMSVTAEGVETPEQLDMLRSLGVNFAQGYLLGRPAAIGRSPIYRILYPDAA